jgi:Cu/Ag efflux protein CusF
VDDISLSRDRLLAKVVLREKSLAVGPSQRPRRWLAMNRRQLWFAGATAVALTIVVLGLTALRNRYPQPLAEGDFHVVRDGQEVSAGQRVDRGEKIITGQGEAELRLGGYCHLVMKPHTELVLNGQPGAEEVELRSGSLASRIVPGRGEFTCRTPLGIVRVLGTEFVTTVEYPRLAEGEEPMKREILVTVAVVSGIVAFDLAGQSGTLSAEESRTFSQQEETQTKTGVVRSVDVAGKKIVVMVARELMFTVTENTKIHRRDDAKKLDDIKVGDKVAVEYTREGETRTAKKIAILAEEEKKPEKLEGVQTKEGEVKKVDVAGNKLVVMVGTELTFTVTEKTEIRQGQDVKKLADVKVGDRVKVSYNRTGDNRVATSIAILKAEKKD